MRARWFVPLIGLVAVAVTALVLLAGGDEPSSPSSASPAADQEEGGSSSAFTARAVTVGGVDIVIEPVRIDETGAVFRVAMDTHSGELSADLASTSVLAVDGVEWTGATWSGDPPGGHHREGELIFGSSGPAAGSAVLSIGGFSRPVKASWALST